MRGCGHSRYAKFCSEHCQMVAHDQEHDRAIDWAGECEICDARLDKEKEDAVLDAMVEADQEFQTHKI